MSKSFAIKFNPQNYENLSIEDKLKYRDEQVRLALERSVDDYNKITDLEFHIKRLEEQLVEKDKEIKEYKTQIKEFCGTKLAKLIDKKEQEIRKEVCDEIKIALTSTEPNCSIADLDSNLYEFSGREICAVLDQIEQGEQ